ncbi:tyrosine-type recombinase/integrase [Roseomonas genomospecies 6]|uniref:Tyr recombinase domain-containing protein n=1 Tax=Roseomonas genomospecies 6 TaxID=214106 RepID=A0A9W7NL37_9PROT|nr:tyrosine-type recombinase/integrase [Roseomonas genomospecies 6]KAA0681899.1 hypothetical protein DS843_09015 [Roseomonas genomospecies 6]
MTTIQNEKVELEDGNVVLYRRDDVKKPVWHCRISIPEIPYKNKRFTTRKTDLEEAKKVALREYQRMVFLHGEGLPVYTKTFEQVWAAFHKEQQTRVARGDLSKGRLRSMAITGNTYFVPFFGSKQISRVSEADVHAYWDWRRRYWTDGPGKERLAKARDPKRRNDPDSRIHRIAEVPASTTLHIEAGLLKQIFDLARRNKDVRSDQVPPIDPPEALVTNRRPAFTMDEWNHLCTFMPAWVERAASAKHRFSRERMQCYVHIMYGTGMRVPNAYNLRWKHYNTFFATDGKEYIKLEVTGKIRVGKPYTVVGSIELKKWFDRLRTLSNHTKPDDYIFVNENGSQLKAVHDHFARLLVEADLRTDGHGQERTTYSLRHTFATHALLDGVDVFKLAKAMNTSVKMIEEHYGHVKNEQNAPALHGNRTKQITLGSTLGITVSVPPEDQWGNQAPVKTVQTRKNKK